MLIRSQDKEDLVILDDIGIKVCSDRCEIEAYKHGVHCVLGAYSTKAKAMKVLDMIQSAYETSLYCDHAFDQSANVMRPYIFANNRVFQMPSDEKVEV
jgi:hypothetical protein